MKVGIYGAGGMGTVLGAYISKAGYDIDLVNRNKDHVLGLNKNGAQIIGKTNFTQKVKAILPEEMKDKYDIILLMTKQRYNQEVVESLIPYLYEESLVCTMQNGLPEDSIADAIGKDRTCGCVMSWGATFHGNGISELTSEATRNTLTFNIGKFGNNDNNKFDYIVQLLNTMGTVTVEENFIGIRWAKLLINSAFSGLSVITDANFGDISKHKFAKLIALEVIKEGIEVAKAAKIKIEPIQGKNIEKYLNYKTKFRRWISLMILPIAMKKHQLIKSSMLRDLQSGKETEIDYINGVIKRYGIKYKISTPYNNKIIEIVKKIEKKELKSTWSNIDYFKSMVQD